MLRKKPNVAKNVGWTNYKENFSDLLGQETPKRKKRRGRKSLQTIQFSSFSQEIQAISSDDEEASSEYKIQPFVEDNLSSPQSPVLDNSMRFSFSSAAKLKSTPSGSHLPWSGTKVKSTPLGSPTLRSCSKIKSTPSGSPVLLRSQQKSTNKTLIPLSPITPGVKWDNSMQNKSAFSIHLHESGHEVSNLDQTPLALPLMDFSDDEIEENNSGVDNLHIGNRSLNLSQDLDSVDTQSTERTSVSISEYEENELNLPGSGFSPLYKKPNNSSLNTTGSKWLEGIKEKIEEEWQREASKFYDPDYCDISHYDSGKKDKFVKGGLAEQLNRILRKDTSKKSVFLHQLKTNKLEKPEGVLKIISDTRECGLHVIECKILSGLNDPPSDTPPTHPRYVTLILPHDFVLNLSLNLGITFKLYKPFYIMTLKPLKSQVILCAYYIQLGAENAPFDSPMMNSISGSNLLKNQSPKSGKRANGCQESLLKSLEAQSSIEDGISVVATVQRIFCRTFMNSPLSWSLLCEDAYGTFFIVEIDDSLAKDETWIQTSRSCEGQRVIFNDLFVGSRATRTQYPSLFSIIDSIWCGNGQGLLQVPSLTDSQSLGGDPSQGSSTQLLPPSYCYLLYTKGISGINMPLNSRERLCSDTECTNTALPVSSELNRSKSPFSPWTDVLYKCTTVWSLVETQGMKSTEISARFSLICTFIGSEKSKCSSQEWDVNCSEHNNDYKLYVTDNSLIDRQEERATLSISVRCSCFLPPELIKFTEQKQIILKDVYKQNDDVIADGHSRIILFNCICEIESILSPDIFKTSG